MEKMYLFGNTGNGGGYNNGNDMWGAGGGWPIWMILIWALFGGRGFGNWGNGGGGPEIPAILNGDAGRELLMNAIQGNANAINSLASSLNCSVGQIQASLNTVNTQICSLGNQVGMSGMQVINAIQAGNNSLAAQLAQCCCENRLAICNQTNTLQNSINSVATGNERGFANLGFETQRQTCAIEKSISDSTEKVLAGQRAAEMRELQGKIDALREENSTYKASAMTSQIVAQATAPLGAALSDISARLGKIECAQPETVKVPYSPVVGVPNCVAAQYGIYGGLPYGAGTGFWG